MEQLRGGATETRVRWLNSMRPEHFFLSKAFATLNYVLLRMRTHLLKGETRRLRQYLHARRRGWFWRALR